MERLAQNQISIIISPIADSGCRSKRARVSAAVEQNILPGQISGMPAADESAERAEFFRRAEALGRIVRTPRFAHFIDALAGGLGRCGLGRGLLFGVVRFWLLFFVGVVVCVCF